MLSFSSKNKQKNPDFVIDTGDKPILIEVGINKTTTKQITKSNIKYRYGIIINTSINKIDIKADNVFLPLKWFLIL